MGSYGSKMAQYSHGLFEHPKWLAYAMIPALIMGGKLLCVWTFQNQ